VRLIFNRSYVSNRDSSDGIVARPHVRQSSDSGSIPGGDKNLLSIPIASRQVTESAQPLNQQVPRVRRPELEADHLQSTACRTEV